MLRKQQGLADLTDSDDNYDSDTAEGRLNKLQKEYDKQQLERNSERKRLAKEEKEKEQRDMQEAVAPDRA